MWFPISSDEPARQQKPSARLTVEALEDRNVPGFLGPVTSLDSGARVFVADFSHDGRDDIAVIRGQAFEHSIIGRTYDTVLLSGKNTVSVSLSNGDGTFRKLKELRGAGAFLTASAARDVNGDGHQDIVVSTFTRSSPGRGEGGNDMDPTLRGTGYDNVWLGKGDGTFHPARTTSYPVQELAYIPRIYLLNLREVTADFNGDAIGDRATADGNTSVLSVALGNPNGTYQSPQPYAAGPSPGWIATGDFNGDGRTDLIVINSLYSQQPTQSVLLNDGIW